MRTSILLAAAFAVALFSRAASPASEAATVAGASRVLVFAEPNFPAADTAAVFEPDLHAALPDAAFVDAQHLDAALAADATATLVLPYGSAFPEASWGTLYQFLAHGGNLVALGGQPFTRAAYRDAAGWHLRDASARFIRELKIDQYQPVPASDGLTFHADPDLVPQLPAFSWSGGFSPIINLSAENASKEPGTSGTPDARLDVLAWGEREGRRLAAPLIRIDHLERFAAGGRWVFLDASLPAGFGGSAAGRAVIAAAVEQARAGAQELRIALSEALYTRDEPASGTLIWHARAPRAVSVHLTIHTDAAPHAVAETTVSVAGEAPFTLPLPAFGGLFTVEARVVEGGRTVAVDHSGFWRRDEAYLRSGPTLGVAQNYFTLDGQPLPVVGTTHMSSTAQRLSFDRPNAWVWDRDLAQIAGAGLNMVRTGWWTGWEHFLAPDGRPTEHALRTLEAYLMTARRHGLPVQFNLFAFNPELVKGANSWFDPASLQRQHAMVGTLAARFGRVPYLAWDLINEPSPTAELWRMRANGDARERAAWNAWLDRQGLDHAALAQAWDTLPFGPTAATPADADFTARGPYGPDYSARVYDFSRFAQDVFADWVAGMRRTIRDAGSKQLITVGTDEGGSTDRLLVTYFADHVDFTTNHSWWQNDALLWDSLVAKVPGKPMLIQETGITREPTIDGLPRRSPDNEGALFERKAVLSFARGAGVIEWLWNTNDLMTSVGEAHIGALRADGTEKPEAAVLRGLGAFATAARAHFHGLAPAPVTIVASVANQLSTANAFAVTAQQNAVRALCYRNGIPATLLFDNRLAELGQPKLVILPSAQSLAEPAWHALLAYVKAGGSLLITGPVERDAHGRRRARLQDVGLAGAAEPLTFRTARVDYGTGAAELVFGRNEQTVLESLRFAHGATFVTQPFGAGRIFWAAAPLELAQDPAAAAAVYQHVLDTVGVARACTLNRPLAPGVVVFPVPLADATLYVCASDDAADADIDLTDRASGAKLAFSLRSQHAALVLLDRHTGQVLASYGR